MGVWTSGPTARAYALANLPQQADYSAALPDWQKADIAGSPYAIAEYEVPENLGRAAGLEHFRARLNDRGIKLILDFVPNHMGLDSPWVALHPNRFIHTEPNSKGAFSKATADGVHWLAHGKDPNFPAWADTVQLDYRRSETRGAMVELIQSVAARCDGVRCDMAMLLLNEVFARTWSEVPQSDTMPAEEFWQGAIASVKRSRPDFLFLAEAYWGLEARLQALGFDFTYDKALYDLLLSHTGSEVQRYVLSQFPESLKAGAHFLENHDEPRVASLLQWPKHRAAAVVVLALPGLRLLHEGQLAGWRRRVPVQLVRRMVESTDPEIEKGYRELLQSLRRSAVGKGTAQVLAPHPAWSGNPSAENFVLIQWQTDGTGFDLVAVNYASHRSQCYVPLNLARSSGGTWEIKDRLSAEQYLRSDDDLRQRGFYLDLEPFGAHIFEFGKSA